MATRVIGEFFGQATVDEEGYRTYPVTFKIESDDCQDGPSNVRLTPGLFLPGAPWAVFNDFDPWVWCRPTKRITPAPDAANPHAAVRIWFVEQEFSNKPLDGQDNKCCDQEVEDPILEPPRVRLHWQQENVEKTHDRFGKFIKNSCHERITGPVNEWPASRCSVSIEQNRLLLEPELLEALKDCLNDAYLWGFPPGWIKFRPESAEEHYYGQCYRYYTRSLCFDIKEGGWDRDIADEGTQVLNGHWGAGSGTGCELTLTTGSGDGCQVNVLTVDPSGRVLTVELGSGGAGYPTDARVQLTIDEGLTPASVIGLTNGSGVVTRLLHTQLYEGAWGSGYATGLHGTTARFQEGAIKSATVTNGGSDYPVSSTFQIRVTSKGTGGTVVVKSNASGSIITGAGGVVKISKAGSGYSDGISSTGFESGWILDDIDGEPPDPDNPAHFIRAKDRSGENKRMALDGGGCPVANEADAGTIHVEGFRRANLLLLGLPLVIGP